jgi:hypothetical protein
MAVAGVFSDDMIPAIPARLLTPGFGTGGYLMGRAALVGFPVLAGAAEEARVGSHQQRPLSGVGPPAVPMPLSGSTAARALLLT